MSRSSFPAVLLCLLLGMLIGVIKADPVQASSTIYIRSDGSVEPSSAPVSTTDRVTYTFTADVDAEIVVERNGIVIDGAGHMLQGMGILNSTGLYLSGVSDVQIRNTHILGFFSAIKLDWSADIEVTWNNLTSNDFGIWLHESTGILITANSIQGGWCGINLAWSRNTDVHENRVLDNEYGVLLHWSSDNDVSGNILADNGCGISLAWSSNNNLEDNSVTNVAKRGSYGVRLHSSAQNTITGNRITNTLYGVRMLYESVENSLKSNNVTGNLYGIYLSYASNNIIHHNDFVGNTNSAESYMSTNTWDNGYPSGGNYWNDYKGIDEKSGPNQDQPGNDGIGDAPYVIDESNSDRYPLIGEIQQAPPLVDPGFLYLLFAAAAVASAGAMVFLVLRRRKPRVSERAWFSGQLEHTLFVRTFESVWKLFSARGSDRVEL